MPAPALSGELSIASGSLSTLDRYSAYGVTEPNVAFSNSGSLSGDSVFLWDYVTIAVQPTSFTMEYSGTTSLLTHMEGSNNGTDWTALPGGVASFDGSTPNIQRFVVSLTSDKFYRYLRYKIDSGSSVSSFKLYALRYDYSSSRPVSTEPGGGGVDPGGDGSGGGANDPGGINDPSTHPGFAMSDLSVYMGDMVLDWIKGNAMGTPPANVYIALFDGDPDDPDTPGSELTGTLGLTRQEVTFGSVVARYMLNTNKLEFGIPDSEVTVACFCVYDAGTDGNRITKKVLTSPATFDNSTNIIIQPGKLPVYY